MVDPDGWKIVFVDNKGFEKELEQSDPLEAYCSTDPSADECRIRDV